MVKGRKYFNNSAPHLLLDAQFFSHEHHVNAAVMLWHGAIDDNGVVAYFPIMPAFGTGTRS